MPEPSTFDVETAMKNLKRHKSLGTDQIPADLIKAGGTTLHSEIQKLINSVRKKEEMPEEWKWWIIVPIHKKGDKTDCSMTKQIVAMIRHITLVSYMKNFIQHPAVKFNSICRGNYWE
jgi:hypothetical protein